MHLIKLIDIIGEDLSKKEKKNIKKNKFRNELEALKIEVDLHRNQIMKLVSGYGVEIPKKIDFQYQPIRVLNAYANLNEVNNSYSVIINSSIKHFLKVLNFLMFYLLAPSIKEKEKVHILNLTVPKLISMLTSGGIETYTFSLEMPSSALSLSSIISTYFGLRFIIAHELFHIINGHKLRFSEEKRSSSVLYAIQAKQEELEADKFAANIIIKSFKELDKKNWLFHSKMIEQGILLSPLFFLFALRILEGILKIDNIFSDYPTAEERFNAVKVSMSPSLTPEYRYYLKLIENLWKISEQTLLSSTQKHYEVDEKIGHYSQLVNKSLSELSIYNYDLAKHYAQEAMNLDPDKWNAYEVMYIAMSESGEKKDAILFLKKFMELMPFHEELSLNLAIDLLSLGKEDEAALYFEKVRAVQPNHRFALENLLRIYIEKKDHNKFQSIAEKLLTKEDINDNILYECSKIFIKSKEYQKARTCIRRALKINPENETYRILLSDIQYLLGRYEEAHKEFAKAKKVLKLTHGENAALFQKIHDLIASEEYDKAINLIQSNLKEYKDEPKLLSYLLICYVQAEKYTLAIKVGNKLLDLNVVDPIDYLMIGIAFLSKGKRNKAKSLLKKALITAEGEIKELEEEDYAEMKMIRQALAAAHFYLGNCSYKEKDLKNSLKHWKKSYDSDPNHENLGNMMLAHLELHNYDDVVKTGLKGIEKGFEGPGIYYNLACAYARKGNIIQSARHLKKAKEFDNNVLKMASNDEEFNGIWNDKEFQTLLN